MITTADAFGLAVGRSEYVPLRSVIGRVETSPNGNVIVRVGREHEAGGWQQTEHVVLTRDEAHGLIESLYAALEDGRDRLQKRADEIHTADRASDANRGEPA